MYSYFGCFKGAPKSGDEEALVFDGAPELRGSYMFIGVAVSINWGGVLLGCSYDNRPTKSLLVRVYIWAPCMYI